jgi:membrane protein DedA with SNARE-associated domain
MLMHLIIIYTGILIGIVLEGEMIMMSSVIAAHSGYLNLWMVIVIGFTGTLASDWFYFFMGRKKGKNWLLKKQKIKYKVEKVTQKFQKYPAVVILSYRFVYGFRSFTPVIIGSSEIKTMTFLSYSFVSTLVWCLVYSMLGYGSGEIIKSKLAHIESIELYIIGSLLLVGLVIFLLKRIRKG